MYTEYKQIYLRIQCKKIYMLKSIYENECIIFMITEIYK